MFSPFFVIHNKASFLAVEEISSGVRIESSSLSVNNSFVVVAVRSYIRIATEVEELYCFM